MPFPLVLVGLAALSGAGLVLTRKPSKAQLSPSTGSSRFKGDLKKGQLYRVWLRVPATYITALRTTPQGQKGLLGDLGNRLEASGFDKTLLVTQDPTDATVFTAITRWGRSDGAVKMVEPLDLARVEAVEEPPELATLTYEPVPACLDEGLTPGEVAAITAALASNLDPKHLTGFAATLEPHFPIAASFLRAKGSLAATRAAGSEIAKENEERAAQVGARLVQAVDKMGWYGDEARAFATTKNEPAKRLAIVTKALPGTGDGWKDAAKNTASAWLPLHRIVGIEDSLATIKGFLEPGTTSVAGVALEPLNQASELAKELPGYHPLFSMVPNPGSGTPAMWLAAAALALTQPLPGTPNDLGKVLAKAFPSKELGSAFLLGYRQSFRSVQGSFLDERGKMPDIDSIIAYDTGSCLGRAKALQDAGFATYYLGTRGKNLLERSSDFANAYRSYDKKPAIGLAKVRGSEILGYAAPEVREPIAHRVRQCIVELCKDGSTARHGELERRFGVRSDIASAARSVVREVADNVRVVDPQAYKALLPSTGKEHIVSPSALQLALAGAKPFGSNVLVPESITARIEEINAGVARKDPEAIKAKMELLKAQKTLERRRWVEWFRKQNLGPYKPGQAPATSGTLTGGPK